MVCPWNERTKKTTIQIVLSFKVSPSVNAHHNSNDAIRGRRVRIVLDDDELPKPRKQSKLDANGHGAILAALQEVNGAPVTVPSVHEASANNRPCFGSGVVAGFAACCASSLSMQSRHGPIRRSSTRCCVLRLHLAHQEETETVLREKC